MYRTCYFSSKKKNDKFQFCYYIVDINLLVKFITIVIHSGPAFTNSLFPFTSKSIKLYFKEV